MVFPLFLALAPALACLLLCVFVEGRLVTRWRVFVRRLGRDEAMLEMLAELTVHLSTYGSAVVGWLVHVLFREEPGVMLPLLVGVPWFVALLRISLRLRRVLQKLRG